MKPWWLLATPLLLGGCVHELPRWGKCRDKTVQGIVGQKFTPWLADRLKNRSHAHEVRAVRPGEMTTMEFNAKRLTATLDERDKILALRCG